jgi:peptidoglycan/LPS O-acetylase OafA/YrhL
LPTARTTPRQWTPGYRFAVRNRYLDLLRAAAIVRVIIYHLFGWPWLSIVLPAMGVMFALAGSLTAASLDQRGAANVVGSRLRRLLPPLWLLALLAVPVMLALGWARQDGGQVDFRPAQLLLWILPIGDPPGSDRAVDVWEPLWYIRAYLWFVLLSPVMYLAYKKLGWAAVAAPIVLIAVLDKTGFSLPDIADAAMWDFVTFAACWMAGFAHHDGRLARTRPAVVIGAALVLGAAAMYWLKGHPGEDGYDLNDVTESQALWSLAFVLVLLRWQPPMGWLSRVRSLDRTVTLLNGRAVTIYLWHNLAIAAVWPVLTLVALDDLGGLDDTVALITAVALTAIAVLTFGWVDDLAARRRPRLWPIMDVPRLEPAGSEPAGSPGGGSVDDGVEQPRAVDGMPHQRIAEAVSALHEKTQLQPALPGPAAGAAAGAAEVTAEWPVVEFGLPATTVRIPPARPGEGKDGEPSGIPGIPREAS